MTRRLFLMTVVLFTIRLCNANVINVTTNDSFQKIESAQAGDEIVIAPGTYHFRVHLKTKASADRPIVIRAENPADKPIWDFSGGLVENAPGSHTAGDRGRGGWQIDGGANYRISGIVFANCHCAEANSAGMRYYNHATGITLKDCIFRDNDNGITGGSQDSDIVVESCEFARNGNLSATNSGPTHNMYIFGGTFTLRYCLVHDSVQAENFHIRAKNATLEYNWFARAKSYEGDLMSDGDFSGTGPFAQTMILRGNVFLQNQEPQNHSQVLVILNDTRKPNLTLSLTVINNTFVGNNHRGQDGNAAFVHLANADDTAMNAQIFNNIIFGTTVPVRVDKPDGATVSGENNWLANGVNPGPLANTIFSASPGFKNVVENDFTLVPTSAAVGHANQTIPGLPTQEYFRDEKLARKHRMRKSAKDIGAFESTTSGYADN